MMLMIRGYFLLMRTNYKDDMKAVETLQKIVTGKCPTKKN